MGLEGFLLGSPILYLKGMRILMFQLSGIYYKVKQLALAFTRFLRRALLIHPFWVHGNIDNTRHTTP